MSNDYATGGKRKSKNDKRKKRKQNVYKKGGKYRSSNVQDSKNKD